MKWYTYIALPIAVPLAIPVGILVLTAGVVWTAVDIALTSVNAKFWRDAHPRKAAEAEARLFALMCSSKFIQLRIAGLHTVVFFKPNSDAHSHAVAEASGSTTPLNSENGASNDSVKRRSRSNTPGASSGRGHGDGAPSSSAARGRASSDHRDVHDPSVVLTAGNPAYPPMVLLHGYGSGSALWVHNVDDLTKGYPGPVVAVDWRGCASSDRAPWKFGVSTSEAEEWMLSSLESWRRAIGADKLVLVGHSLGGYLSSAYAVRYPQHVAGLFLVSPAGMPNPPPGALPTKTKKTGDAPVMNGGMVRSDPASPTPRRLPPFLWKFVSYMWESDFTPGRMIRNMGPLARSMTRSIIRRRGSRWILRRPLPSEAYEELGEYLYHAHASQGSGEFALRPILAPGAWARDAMGERLIAAFGDGSSAVGSEASILSKPSRLQSAASDMAIRVPIGATDAIDGIVSPQAMDGDDVANAGAPSSSADGSAAAASLVAVVHPANPRSYGTIAASNSNSNASTVSSAAKPAASISPSVPIVFFYGGTHDWMSIPAGEEVSRELSSRGIVRTAVHLLPKSGHHCYLENPDDFNRLLLEECKYLAV